MVHRIAIAGTYCQGKSTLYKALMDEMGIDGSQDHIRSFIERSRYEHALAMPRNVAIRVAIASQLKNLGFEVSHASFVSEAPVFVHLGNAAAARDHYKIPKAAFDLVEKGLLSYAKSKIGYNTILYLPDELAMEEDSVRPSDPELRASIDKHVRRLLHGLPVTEINGNEGQRLEKALRAIRG